MMTFLFLGLSTLDMEGLDVRCGGLGCYLQLGIGRIDLAPF